MNSGEQCTRPLHVISRRHLFVIIAIVILLAVFPRVFGSDDSNPPDFSTAPTQQPGQPGGSSSGPPNSTSTPAVPPVSNTTSQPQIVQDQQKITNALDKLSQGTNNTNVMDLLTGLRNSNYTQAQMNLDALKALLANPNSSTQLPASVRDMIGSMNCSSTNCTVNLNSLANLVQPVSTNWQGVPIGLSGMDPSAAANSLDIFAEMAKGQDHSLSQDFAGDSFQINQFLGHGPQTTGTVPSVPIPNAPVHVLTPSLSALGGLSSLAGLGGMIPNALGAVPGALGAIPSLFGGGAGSPGGGSPGAGSPSSSTTGQLLIPILAVALSAVGILLIRRKRLRARKTNLEIVALDPSNPRHAIIIYFRRAVDMMFRRGVPKRSYETHREFSSKCDTRPESQHVRKISGLYEKAMFSGQEVTTSDADDARREVSLIETVRSGGTSHRGLMRRVKPVPAPG